MGFHHIGGTRSECLIANDLACLVDADITASPVIASVDETGIDLQLDYGYLRPTELRGTGNQYIYAILNDLTVQPVRFVDVPDQGAESILWLMCRSLETGSRVTFECVSATNALALTLTAKRRGCSS